MKLSVYKFLICLSVFGLVVSIFGVSVVAAEGDHNGSNSSFSKQSTLSSNHRVSPSPLPAIKKLLDVTHAAHSNATHELKNSSLSGKHEKLQPSTHTPLPSLSQSKSNSSRPTTRSTMFDEITIKQMGYMNDLSDIVHPSHEKLPIDKFHPMFATVAAFICITAAVGGYTFLLCWRRMEIKKYGNRQMLINEDDFGDIQDEDMRHFEASCIQIDV